MQGDDPIPKTPERGDTRPLGTVAPPETLAFVPETQGEDDSFERLLKAVARIPEISPAARLLPGTTLDQGRFTVRRMLGEGGMGVVYEAWDRSLRGSVALKCLNRGDPKATYYLKNEFRALAEITHPNLVSLHQFFGTDDAWFFTMELVRGDDFLTYVRGGEFSYDSEQTRRGAERRFDEGKLRDALAQLARGVMAIHAARKLHCDLKPANVLVEPSGRVVILDFGLITDRSHDRIGQTLGMTLAGTPAYMAPEQATFKHAEAASDAYAIGVMLFEALTGRLPFTGTDPEVLIAKQSWDPPPPSSLAPGVPPDLEALCLRLLARDPAGRPSLGELLRAVEPTSAGSSPGFSTPPLESLPFVGREAELAALGSELSRIDGTTPAVVFLTGRSGIGKSRLAREFIERKVREGRVIALHGRCHERESIPFNAFDSLIDALSRYLRKLPPVRAATFVPRDVPSLLRLFPTLSRVEAIAAAPARPIDGHDAIEVRRRGFRALKTLLSHLSDAAPLILHVDDLHWADEDSVALLRELISEPDPPAMLFLATLRSETAGPASWPESLSRLGVEPREIRLAPLANDEATTLLRSGGTDEETAHRLAKEADGNPFFLRELLRHVEDREDATRVPDLEEMIVARHRTLPEEARRLVEVLAIAGRPCASEVALRAAELDEGAHRALTIVRNVRWLNVHRGASGEKIALHHDRIRTAVLGALDEEARRRGHRRLAESLSEVKPLEHELLAEHWTEAGEPKRAAIHFFEAANVASSNCAFGVAARAYARALDGRGLDRERERTAYARLGAALSRAGRAGEAAEAFLRGAEIANGRLEGLSSMREAAAHFLACGKLTEGSRVLREALRSASIDYPETPAIAAEWLKVRAQEVRARLGGTPDRVAASNEGTRLEADICAAVAPPLGWFDFVRAGYFSAHGLVRALDTGDPMRIARAKCLYSTSLASAGDVPEAAALADDARRAAEELEEPHLIATAALAQGQVSLFAGDFARALEQLDAARHRFVRCNSGESLEIPNCDMFANMALYMLGRWAELASRSEKQLLDARERGHLLVEASVRVFGVALGALMRGDVTRAREQAVVAQQIWREDEFHGEMLKVLRLEIWCDLYEGKERSALDRLLAARKTTFESLLLKSRYWRFWWLGLTAQAALSAAAKSNEPEFLALAAEAIEELENDGLPYARPLVTIYRAGLAHLDGDAERARADLEQASRDASPILAACVDYQRSRIAEERADAETLRTGARARLAAIFARPERWADWLVPGFSSVD